MKSLTHLGVHPHLTAAGAPPQRPAGESEARAAQALQGRVAAPNEVRQPGSAGGSLGTIANKVPFSADAQRRLRFERRQKSSAWVIGQARLDADLPFYAEEPGLTANDPGWIRPPRIARCRWRVAPVVGVHGGPGTRAHFSGVERCSSIWACPVCSAVIRTGRAAEINSAVEEHRKNGGALLFLTLTLRHDEKDSLALTLNAILQGWTKLVRGASWSKQKKALGLQGFIRATEITRGKNGWHPHAHVLLFLDQKPGKEQVQKFQDWVYKTWAKKVTELGAGLPSEEHGVDLRSVESITEIAQYLAKIQEKNISKEIARSDLKTGRNGSINPFELLDQPLKNEEARRLWNEYYSATKGRRAITWSRGLRDLLLLEEEKTDQEILEETEAGEVLEQVSAETWDKNKNKPGWLALLLEEAELPSPRFAEILRAVEIEGCFIDPKTGEFLGQNQTGATPLIAEQEPGGLGVSRAAKPAKRTLYPRRAQG